MIVRRGMLTDHYVEGDRSVVMVEESVLGLSPIATAILDAVPEGSEVTLQAVTDHVVAAFGPPEGPEPAETLTQQQLWDLVAHRVLIVVKDDQCDDASRVVEKHPPIPDCDRPEEAVSALRDALRHLRSDDHRPWAPPASLSPQGFVRAARQHHVVSFLAANGDRLEIPGQARSQLEVLASRQRAGAKVLAADLSVALQALEGAGIRALPFKGVALAAQAYSDFQIRGAGDLDLLVAPEDLASAHKALTGAGWQPAGGYPRPGASWAWRHLMRTGNELSLLGQTIEIDLHWHLAPVRSTFPSFEVLWERRDLVLVDGLTTPTLSRYDALAHSAGHAAKDGWQWLRSLVDVHVLMSDRDTWLAADRPLRADQLLSVGIAAQQLGRPTAAPAVVDIAARRVATSRLEALGRSQRRTAAAHRSSVVPGAEFVNRAKSLQLTHGSVSEAVRLVGRTALPPWHTAEEESSRAVRVVPKVLGMRLREFASKARRARQD